MFNEKTDAIHKVARIVRGARKQLAYSQIEMARTLNISQGSLSKIEAGQLTLTPEQWYGFCEHVRISPDQSWYSGYIDRCTSTELEEGPRVGSFRIPKRYARHRGSKVRSVRPILSYFEKNLGEKKLSDYLEKVNIDEDFFITLDNQINVNFSLDLLRTLIDQGALKKNNISELAAAYRQPNFHGALASTYQSADSKTTRFIQLAKAIKNYDVNCKYQFENVNDQFLEISVTPNEHFKNFDYRDDTLQDCLCRYKKEAMKAFANFGTHSGNGSGIELQELECHFTSHSPKCVYRLQITDEGRRHVFT